MALFNDNVLPKVTVGPPCWLKASLSATETELHTEQEGGCMMHAVSVPAMCLKDRFASYRMLMLLLQVERTLRMMQASHWLLTQLGL